MAPVRASTLVLAAPLLTLAAGSCATNCYGASCDYWDGGYWGTCAVLENYYWCDCSGCECDGCPQGSCDEPAFDVEACPNAGDATCDDYDAFNSAACAYDGGDCCESTCEGVNCGRVGYNCRDPAASDSAYTVEEGLGGVEVPQEESPPPNVPAATTTTTTTTKKDVRFYMQRGYTDNGEGAHGNCNVDVYASVNGVKTQQVNNDRSPEWFEWLKTFECVEPDHVFHLRMMDWDRWTANQEIVACDANLADLTSIRRLTGCDGGGGGGGNNNNGWWGWGNSGCEEDGDYSRPDTSDFPATTYECTNDENDGFFYSVEIVDAACESADAATMPEVEDEQPSDQGEESTAAAGAGAEASSTTTPAPAWMTFHELETEEVKCGETAVVSWDLSTGADKDMPMDMFAVATLDRPPIETDAAPYLVGWGLDAKVKAVEWRVPSDVMPGSYRFRAYPRGAPPQWSEPLLVSCAPQDDKDTDKTLNLAVPLALIGAGALALLAALVCRSRRKTFLVTTVPLATTSAAPEVALVVTHEVVDDLEALPKANKLTNANSAKMVVVSQKAPAN